MPSLALSPPVTAASPVAASAGVVASTSGSAAADAAATGNDANTATFSDVLGRQLAQAGNGKDSASGRPTTQGKTELDSGLAFLAPADLSALLQGLMLPAMKPASHDVAATGDAPLSASTRLSGADPLSALSLPAVRGDAAPGASETDVQFADSMQGMSPHAAKDAEVTALAADSAGKDLPLEHTLPEAPAQVHAGIHAAPTHTAARESVTIQTPVGTPGWESDLGHHMSLLIGKDVSSAELVLTPPHLGRVEVQLTVSGDQAQANFVAATPAARDALEQALPKLREWMADAGINLAQASVGSESGRGTHNESSGQRGTRGNSAGLAEITTASLHARNLLGLVDTFA